MSNYSFRPSTDALIGKQVFIALAGTTGAGKTETGMRICSGIVGATGKFCVIDTEHKRALNKKSRYNFDHLDMRAPYSPDNFKGAIDAAESAGYGAIMIDNFSHEWFGEGGCSDMQEEVLERMSKGDSSKAERLTAIAWKAPKQSHKKLMYRILQCNVPVIFCLRAEPKIKFQKDERGKMQIVDAGWQPICEKMFGYEMLVYALMMPDNPGAPVHLKKLEKELDPMFPVGKQITEESGKLIAQWASGSKSAAPPRPASDSPPPPSASDSAAGNGTITPEQAISNISKAVDADTLTLAKELALELCKSAPDKLAASAAYRSRLAELKAIDNEVTQ